MFDLGLAAPESDQALLLGEGRSEACPGRCRLGGGALQVLAGGGQRVVEAAQAVLEGSVISSDEGFEAVNSSPGARPAAISTPSTSPPACAPLGSDRDATALRRSSISPPRCRPRSSPTCSTCTPTPLSAGSRSPAATGPTMRPFAPARRPSSELPPHPPSGAAGVVESLGTPGANRFDGRDASDPDARHGVGPPPAEDGVERQPNEDNGREHGAQVGLVGL